MSDKQKQVEASCKGLPLIYVASNGQRFRKEAICKEYCERNGLKYEPVDLTTKTK